MSTAIKIAIDPKQAGDVLRLIGVNDQKVTRMMADAAYEEWSETGRKDIADKFRGE